MFQGVTCVTRDAVKHRTVRAHGPHVSYNPILTASAVMPLVHG